MSGSALLRLARIFLHQSLCRRRRRRLGQVVVGGHLLVLRCRRVRVAVAVHRRRSFPGALLRQLQRVSASGRSNSNPQRLLRGRLRLEVIAGALLAAVRVRVGVRGLHSSLRGCLLLRPGFKDSHAVEDDGEGGAHVEHHRLPEPGVTHKTQHEYDPLGDDAEDDVLADLGQAQAADGDCLGDATQVVGEERHVRRLHRRGGTCDPHGDANVGGAKRGGIVDAVAHHRERAAADEPAPKRAGSPRTRLKLNDARHHVLHLVCRAQPCVHVCQGDPSGGGDAQRGAMVVPRQHDHLAAHLTQLFDRAGRRRPQGVLAAQRPGHVTVHAHPDGGGAPDFPRRCRRAQRGVRGNPPAALSQRWPANLHQLAVHHRACALTGERLEVNHLALLGGDAHRSAGSRQNRRRHRVTGTRFERARPPQQRSGAQCWPRLGASHSGRRQLRLYQREPSLGQRARLVYAYRLEPAQALEVRAALDEHAAASGAGKPTHRHHRRGQHQCARARHHQQHARLVDVIQAPVPQRERNGGEQYRGDDDHWGVVLGEGLHHALHVAARRLCLFHQTHQPRHRRVRGGGGDTYLQLPALVHRPAEHRGTHSLGHGHALPRERSLVHRAGAAHHDPVEGNLLSWLDQHHLAHRHLLHRDRHIRVG
mmetsp:Transcript_17343/g.42841  ORF Transcript_17343/g.42841 Transcript_17343/m.42841 type:complete len:648 (-) Transcript_17343:1649-3592(-)